MGNKNLKGSILELRKQGKSLRKIKEILNCSISTVSYHVNKNGLGGVHENFKINNMSKEEFLELLNKEDIKKIIKLKKEGKKYKDIFEEVNVSYDKIRRICRIFKINKDYSRLRLEDPIFIQKIKNLYEEIGSIKAVSKQLKIGHKTVKKYIEIKERKKTNKEDRKKMMVKYVDKHRKQRKIDLIKYKGGSCEECGYKKSVWSLIFHHINPEEKEFNIGGKNYTWERMKKEADKCVLVCSNCHGEIHEEIELTGRSKIIENIKSLHC